MWKFWQIGLLDIAVIAVSYLIFRYTLSGGWRHKIWEKYVDSFSMFVIILFVATAVVNVATFLILRALDMKQYVNIVAPAVGSVIVGFVIASVPQRGVGDGTVKKGS
jgi:membrane protease YdiL (CAAX protease family)